MLLKIMYNNHPEDAKKYDTSLLRERFLVEEVFVKDEINLTYSHHDRIVVGGIHPVEKTLSLSGSKEFGTNYFLERREMGIINIGGDGVVYLDHQRFELKNSDGMYIGSGVKDVVFSSVSSINPAKFYINSAPAHQSYPSVHIPLSKAKKVSLGDALTLNQRTIHQYVHPDVCLSCQLVMGLTILAQGSVWNTMPCHTHERRMEVYFYFNMSEQTRVFHLMGEVHETRHLVIKNEQAIIGPSWSIHSGVGTSNYTFIWGMCGENQTFTDMDFVDMSNLR
jgi:4-deoxy-L-threo-5-hexosulose-uronate ketol-isomerase